MMKTCTEYLIFLKKLSISEAPVLEKYPILSHKKLFKMRWWGCMVTKHPVCLLKYIMSTQTSRPTW